MLREIDEFFAVLVARIDPDAVPLCEVTDLWTALDTVERRAATAKLLLARKVEDAAAERAPRRSRAVDDLDHADIARAQPLATRGLAASSAAAAFELLGEAHSGAATRALQRAARDRATVARRPEQGRSPEHVAGGELAQIRLVEAAIGAGPLHGPVPVVPLDRSGERGVHRLRSYDAAATVHTRTGKP